MTTSEAIDAIATALAKAQGEMGGAKKDAANPFFKSKYADLASVRDACIGALSKHGIAVVQSPSAEGATVSVVTLLVHSSGQWMRGVASCTAKDDSPQSVGSATTYLRRYALQSFAFIAPEDDDAEAAHGRGNGQQKVHTQAWPIQPAGYTDWLTDMELVVSEGTERLSQAWKQSAAAYRQFLTTTHPSHWEAMKAAAAKVRETVAQ